METARTLNSMKEIQEQIRSLSVEISEQVKGFRRHLHSHPELSFEEYETSRYIRGQLCEEGMLWTTGIAGTGMVLRIMGKNKGKVLALRADMDALPIQERSEKSYKSQNEGVMHACGHDVHSSCLMGAALIMHRLREHWSGELRCIFQPGEEKLPGGASLMIEEGVLVDPDVECIIGQHVFPELKAGEVGFRSGMYMASTDEVYLKVIGLGGHGAMPHKNIDPVLISAHVLIALQQIVSRQADPTLPSVLSFGKIIGNGATNVTPDYVEMEGTFRTFDERWREQAHQLIKGIAQGTATAMGGSCEVKIISGYPHLKNEPFLTEKCRGIAMNYLGEEKVYNLPLRMTAEDFAYYSQVIPACFYRLGTSSADGRNSASVHTASFDIEEEALEIGVGLMAALAMELLS